MYIGEQEMGNLFDYVLYWLLLVIRLVLSGEFAKQFYSGC
jgi:hypothetical protein